MAVPDWYTLALLALASFRSWRLLAEDVVLDGPRSAIYRLGDWEPNMPVPGDYRERLAEFVSCPWCLGFWLALVWWGAWQLWPHAITVVAVPMALSAVVGLIASIQKGK